MSDVKSKRELKEYIFEELCYFLQTEVYFCDDVKSYFKRLLGQRKHRSLFYNVLRYKYKFVDFKDQQRIDNLISLMKLVYKDV